jgi:hypothetical protein
MNSKHSILSRNDYTYVGGKYLCLILMQRTLIGNHRYRINPIKATLPNSSNLRPHLLFDVMVHHMLHLLALPRLSRLRRVYPKRRR